MTVTSESLRPNLDDYEGTRARFTWDQARSLLDGLPHGRGLNIAHEAVDRHAAGPRADHVALRFLGRDGCVTDRTYADLRADTARFANLLTDLGIEPGERVFSLLNRTPALYVTALGTLKHRSVFCPLFSAFGPEPVRQRMQLGDARILVTTPSLYHRKVAPIRDQLPSLRHVLLVANGSHEVTRREPRTHSFEEFLAAASDTYVIQPTSPNDMALLHFTSGTTGTPKGAVHVHEAVVAHNVTGYYALDLHPDDVFWCTADPGWVTGTSYGIVAPLCNGVTTIVDEVDFDAERWYRVLQDEHVNVWYTAPTAVRMLMRAGDDVARSYDLRSLRLVASVGEPLNPEAVVWGERVLGLPIRDNWWQTETGGIMIANCAADEVRPGSMGRPLPGIEATILQHDERGVIVDDTCTPLEVEHSDTVGELALRPGWPSMFRDYLHEHERYQRCFAGDWYLTGDLARRDADGWYWFVGRGDDVIKSAGHLIGPFEVESALMEHPAVAEAGVIGIPDPVVGERVKAFVMLANDVEPTEELRRELIGFGRKRLGAAVAPKDIEFRDALPHTKSGKVMRRLLRAQELGLATGDTSTLEPNT
ncbi:MAG TPA: acetate--CoA ligase [Acidimicrobiales bacterium]|nr:acetate--CoA ligase [Acidimicrobiales bacterium]